MSFPPVSAGTRGGFPLILSEMDDHTNKNNSVIINNNNEEAPLALSFLLVHRVVGGSGPLLLGRCACVSTDHLLLRQDIPLVDRFFFFLQHATNVEVACSGARVRRSVGTIVLVKVRIGS